MARRRSDAPSTSAIQLHGAALVPGAEPRARVAATPDFIDYSGNYDIRHPDAMSQGAGQSCARFEPMRIMQMMHILAGRP